MKWPFLLVLLMSCLVSTSLLLFDASKYMQDGRDAEATKKAAPTKTAEWQTEWEMAGAIAARALDVLQEDQHHALVLALEAYRRIERSPAAPTAVSHAIRHVLAQTTAEVITGTVQMPPIVSANYTNENWYIHQTVTGTYHLVSFDDLANRKVLSADSHAVQAVTFSNTGRRLALVTGTPRLHLYDLNHANFPDNHLTLTAEIPITQVLFSPNDTWVGGYEETSPHVAVWHFPSEQSEKSYTLPPLDYRNGLAAVTSIGFDHGNKWLAIGYADGNVHLWDLEMLDQGPDEAHIRLQKIQDKITAVYFPIGDRQLIAHSSPNGDGETKTVLWNLDLQQLVTKACRELNAAEAFLTESEWKRYLPTTTYRNPCDDM